MTALNAILARQGMMNPQVGVMNGQQGLPMGGVLPAQQSGIPAQNQAGTIAPPTESMAAQPLAGAGPVNQTPQLASPLTGMANPNQAVTAAPVQGSGPIYENQLNRLMTNQGMAREQAMANQASAVRQGADYNNDGTVGKSEWQRFQQNPSSSAPQTGLIGSEMALGAASDRLQRAGNRAISDLTGGTQQSRLDITNASQAALQPMAGYARSGREANTMQANLLGANGPAAQAAAMQQFQASPGQDFLRQEQERAVLRNAAATGGTQGGAVLEELQRRAYGRAGTAFNDRVAQLGGIGSQGLTAAQGQAGIMGDTGIALSGLAERGAGNLASTRLGIAGQQAGIQGTVAGGRTRAGEQMAQNIGSTTANLANLQNAQGAGLAQILDGGQFAEIMAKAGITDANTLQQLATLLANISTGQGSQATRLGSIPGIDKDTGLIGGIGQAAAGIGTMMALSDARLKENIFPIGKIGPHNLYRWDWKPEALPMVGNQPSVGVIAQEAQRIDPEAVKEINGYLNVDYSRIF